jgi:hypothetical protein
MDLGKSFAWILFLAVVAGAGSLNHHKGGDTPQSAPGPAVQMAAQAPAPAPMAAPATTTVALDTTRHAVVTRTSAALVK